MAESLLVTERQSDEPNVGWSSKNKFELTSRHVLNVNTCTDWKKKKYIFYSRSSRKQPPRKFEIVVVARAGRLREWAFISDRMVKKLVEGGRLREL